MSNEQPETGSATNASGLPPDYYQAESPLLGSGVPRPAGGSAATASLSPSLAHSLSSQGLVQLRLDALREARALMGDGFQGLGMLAATLRLAASIETFLLRGGRSAVDGLAGLFDEVEKPRSVPGHVCEAESVSGHPLFDSTDCRDDPPNEILAGKSFSCHTESTPVAGLDTATVTGGGEAVTASSPKVLA